MKQYILSLQYWLVVLFLSILFSANAEEYQQRTNLPSFFIATDDGTGVYDKVTWKAGVVVVKSSDSSEEIDMEVDIRGRGNSTLGMEKKPYRIKFPKGQKVRLLGLPAQERNWVLLANHADKTLMRNALAFEIGRFLEMDYTPPVRFVDVFFNGDFQGNYMVTDQIEVASYRVPAGKQEEEAVTEPDITGGYLLEMDGFAEGEPEFFYSEKDRNVKFTIKYPKDDEINDAQRNYIKRYIADFENCLFGDNFKDKSIGYRAMVDTASLINWYIASELSGNPDAFWQMFIYKKRNDDKLYFGPLWDYDIAFNNDYRICSGATQDQYVVSAITKLMRESAHAPRNWIERFWQDPCFREAVERRWKELIEAGIEDYLLDFIDKTSAYLEESQKENFKRWNILNQRIHFEVQFFQTYQQGVDNLKTYIEKRVAFLTSSFIVPEDQKPTLPFVAESRHYKIANIKTNKVFSVGNEDVREGTSVVAWESQDEEGQLWNIIDMGDGFFKITDTSYTLAISGSGGVGDDLKLQPVDDNNDAQKWQIVPLGVGGQYGFVNKASGHSINNSGGGNYNGNKIIEYTSKVHLGGSDNQNWYIHKQPMHSTTTTPLMPALQDVEIYSNPASSYAYVKFDAGQGVDVRIAVYDVAGKLVYSSSYNYLQGEQSINLPVGDLRTGLYFVVLKPDGSREVTSKLIVR